MKNYLILAILITIFGCNNNNQNEVISPKYSTSIDTIHLKHKPIDKDTTELHFFIKNLDDKQLIIENINGSCGCTQFLYDKSPISTNESKKITIIYQHSQLVSSSLKNIVIKTNSIPIFKVLYINEVDK